MNILFIAPLPPPIHGQSYVSNELLIGLKKNHNVKVVNFTKKRNAGRLYFIKRYFEVFDVLYSIWKQRKGVDAIYLTISQSFLGNLKDLITYLIFRSNLDKITIHLHGGAIRKELWNKLPILLRFNRYFLRKFNGIIISGESHKEVFTDLVREEKIFTVPNFAPASMFIAPDQLNSKFGKLNPLRVLYVSGMRTKKGYLDLLEGYRSLSSTEQKVIQVDFAGEFETDSEKEAFLKIIQQYDNLKYHGVIDDVSKTTLFEQSHVFCLPTKYLEGQPISILEAYASGCLVLTTNLGGIVDIFKEELNGFQTRVNDPKSIADRIRYCAENPAKVHKIAEANSKLALDNYQLDVFVNSIDEIIVNNK